MDITKLNIEQLESLAYRMSVQYKQAEHNLQIVEAELQRKQKAEADRVEAEAKAAAEQATKDAEDIADGKK